MHGLDGWYAGPFMNHYRCYTYFIPSTGGKINADTVVFFPESIPFPSITSEQYLHQDATNIHAILQLPEKSIPSLTYGSPIINAYIQVAQILKRATSLPISIPAPLPRVPLQDIVPLPRVL